ncbi:MAG: bL17 family ribosomal protein [Clostridia bacterium]|nr:bL17 family ribosomal protein [Clostridia bacterium]
MVKTGPFGGDGAPMCFIELVNYEPKLKKDKKK